MIITTTITSVITTSTTMSTTTSKNKVPQLLKHLKMGISYLVCRMKSSLYIKKLLFLFESPFERHFWETKDILNYYLSIVAYYTCSNFTVTPNWDYSGNDITSRASQTFANCCAWCLNVTSCVAFTLNQQNTCYIKNSTGSGGGSAINATAAAL